MRQITLITGGARSGKSSYAEWLALSLSPNPIYLATSRIWDEGFRQRVLRHQTNRGPEQINIEEEKGPNRHSLQERVVPIDYIIPWCTNYFFDLEADTDKALTAIKTESGQLTEQEAIFIFVTNGVGMGGISESLIQRKPADMQGRTSQYIATRANQVLLMVSGTSVKVKDEKQTID